MKHNFIDNVLIKLKRSYGKDELVSSLISENNSLKNEIKRLENGIAKLENLYQWLSM